VRTCGPTLALRLDCVLLERDKRVGASPAERTRSAVVLRSLCLLPSSSHMSVKSKADDTAARRRERAAHWRVRLPAARNDIRDCLADRGNRGPPRRLYFWPMPLWTPTVSSGSGGTENRLEKWGLPSSEHATDRGSCFFQSFMATSRHKQASRVAVMGGGAQHLELLTVGRIDRCLALVAIGKNPIKTFTKKVSVVVHLYVCVTVHKHNGGATPIRHNCQMSRLLGSSTDVTTATTSTPPARPQPLDPHSPPPCPGRQSAAHGRHPHRAPRRLVLPPPPPSRGTGTPSEPCSPPTRPPAWLPPPPPPPARYPSDSSPTPALCVASP